MKVIGKEAVATLLDQLSPIDLCHIREQAAAKIKNLRDSGSAIDSLNMQAGREYLCISGGSGGSRPLVIAIS